MASVELATGYVTLAAETSQLAKDVGRIFAGAESKAGQTGKAMGQSMARAFDTAKPDVDRLRKEVEVAEQRVSAQVEASARKQEAAKRKVEIAQAKVNEATAKFGPKSSQALSAVDRLATAEQKLEAETLQAASAQDKLERELKGAQDAVEKAAKSSETASRQYATGWKGVGQRVKDHLKRGVKGATDEAEDVAERGGKESGGRFSSAFKGAAAGVFAAMGAREILGGIMDTVNLAGAAEQSVGAVDAVFKEHSKSMHDWASTAATAVGVSANEYRELGSLLGAQLKNAKTPMDQLAGKTNDLIKVGADLSSMFGGSTREAVEALSSALKGEMDPIEKYGISLNETTLKAIALEKGLISGEVDAAKVAARTQKLELAQMKYNQALAKYGKDSVQAKSAAVSLSSAEAQLKDAQAGKIPALDATTKAMAVQLAITEQSKDALGNFSREEDTFAHKQQVAAAQWEDLKIKIGNAFLPALSGAMGFVSETAIPAVDAMAAGLQNMANWVRDNTSWLVPLTAAVGGYAAAMAGLSIVNTVRGWLAAAAAAQWGLNAAMSANPIGIVIAIVAGLVAAIILAYNNIGWFRDMVDGAFGFIRDLIGSVVNWFKTTAVPVWNAAIKVLGGFFGWLWKSIIKPVFDSIGKVFQWLWTSVVKPVWGFIKAYINAAWLVIRGVFQVINSVIRTFLAPAFQWLYKSIIKPVFDSIRSAIKWAWDNVIAPVFRSIRDFVRNTLGPAFTWFRDSVIKPVWDRVKSIIKTVWDNTLKPIFNSLKTMVEKTVPNAFDKGVGMIEDFWNGLKAIAKAPVKFVIETVLNNGLIKGFNTIADILPGVDRLPKIALPKGFSGGGYTGPGDKYQPAGVVHAGEFVFTKEETKAAGVGTLQAIAQKFRGYAKGGLVHPLPGAPVTSGFGPRAGYNTPGAFHDGIDFGMPTGTPIRAAGAGLVERAGWAGMAGNMVQLQHANGLETVYYHMSRVIARVGQLVKAGQSIGSVGSTGNSTGSHLHYIVRRDGVAVNPSAYLSGGGETGTGKGGGWFDPLGAIKGFFDDKIKGLAERFGGGGIMVDLARGVGSKILDTILGWVKGGAGTDSASVYDNGGWLHKTSAPQLVHHKKRAPDAVLTNREWNAVYQIAQDSAQAGGGKGAGAGVVNNYYGPVGFDPEELAREQETKRRRAQTMAGMTGVVIA